MWNHAQFVYRTQTGTDSRTAIADGAALRFMVWRKKFWTVERSSGSDLCSARVVVTYVAHLHRLLLINRSRKGRKAEYSLWCIVYSCGRDSNPRSGDRESSSLTHAHCPARSFETCFSTLGRDDHSKRWSFQTLEGAARQIQHKMLLDHYKCKWKKALRETQTLRAGCSKAEPRIFAPPQTHSRGAGRPKFNQLEMVTTFTYWIRLVKIDARNFELSW